MNCETGPKLPRSARNLLGAEGLLYLIVDAPGSAGPYWAKHSERHLLTAEQLEQYAALGRQMLVIAKGARHNVTETSCRLEPHLRIKVVSDGNDRYVCAVYMQGPLCKSIRRALRNILRGWPRLSGRGYL